MRYYFVFSSEQNIYFLKFRVKCSRPFEIQVEIDSYFTKIAFHLCFVYFYIFKRNTIIIRKV